MRYSTKDASRNIGRSPRSIQRAAAKHGIGKKVGRDWRFTESDLTRLAAVLPGITGNPSFGDSDRQSEAAKIRWNSGGEPI